MCKFRLYRSVDPCRHREIGGVVGGGLGVTDALRATKIGAGTSQVH